MAVATSPPLPPRNVLYKSAVPVPSSFVTNTSVSDWVVSYVPAVVGSSPLEVVPVT